MNELTTSLIDKINESHNAAMQFGESLKTNLVAGANRMRETGIYLLELKAVAIHGSWQDMFATSDKNETSFAFGLRTAQNYMAFAKANPEPIEDIAGGIGSLKALMVECGALPKPSRIEQNEKEEKSQWLSLLLRATGSLTAAIEHNPLKEWDEMRRVTFIEKAKPIVQLFIQAGGKV